MEVLRFMFFSTWFFIFMKFSNAAYSLTFNETLSDGSTLITRDGTFELGFFSPGSDSRRYVGIWYKNIPVRTVVWVANRENPIHGSSGSLMIDSRGNLVLVGKNKTIFWSTNSTKQAQTPVVELLDSGNLVLRDREDVNVENYLWQSFDYPTDTIISGMKVGVNLKTGFERRVIASKSWDDPSPGYFFWRLLPYNIPENTVWNDSRISFRIAPKVADIYNETTLIRSDLIHTSMYVHNEEEAYYMFYQRNKSIITIRVINQTTNRLERFTWQNNNKSWSVYSSQPTDPCDDFALCGAYGLCSSSDSPVCKCLKGFNPKFEEEWNSGYWSQGCVRNKPLNCNGDGFTVAKSVIFPDTLHTWVNFSLDMKQCREKCLENCSCSAYSAIDVRNGANGTGCAIWFNDLIDIREEPSGDYIATRDLFVRVSASDSDEFNDVKSVHRKKKKIVAATVSVIAVVTVVIITAFYLHSTKRRRKGKAEYDSKKNDNAEDVELLPLNLDLKTISKATNGFAVSNKLGQGGFGPVYKGTLLDDQEVAIKRLLSNSGQGVKEFKNEVTLIAKLQHRNLVKLLGCCVHGEERLLIYEYMSNKSLDLFIFDQSKAELLDWSKRFSIICGIARGLLYLHQDSRLRIIHRDLKTSNILLDNEMNPKISNFGMAAFIEGDQSERNTTRVVGTLGYMAPEYAINGLFSVKSDVFSFGIIMLEIISGIKSRGFHHPNGTNLIAHAWTQWREGNYLELIDTFLRQTCNFENVARCIHISLLCVQHHVEERPTMASVILMLSSENYALPPPKEPGFFKDKGPFRVDSSSNKIASPCQISISLLEPR